jgi:tetratricopeptide (TPR) repeat protein
MKPDEPRSPTKQKHVLTHELPTVIHNPEVDMNQLRRWLYHAQENPAKFWGIIAAITLVCLLLSVLASGGLSFGRAKSDEGWTKLEGAQSAADRLDVAKDFPNTTVERWALLQAASEYYNDGFADLPNNKDTALPNFSKAVDNFRSVAEKEPEPNSVQTRFATLGAARALEARGELDKAIKQYEKLTANKAWAGTEEAKLAEHQIKVLKTPEAVAFYEKLYSFKAPVVDLPPGGGQSLDFLKSPISPAPGDSSAKIPGSILDALPTLPSTKGTPGETAKEPNPLTVPPPPPTAAPAKTSDLPKNVFAPEEKK